MATKSQTLELIIKLRDAASQEMKQVHSAFQVGKKALTAFNQESKIGQNIANAFKSQVVQLAGAFAGFKALATLTAKMKEADQANFNLQASLKAANQEFQNVGSIQEWEGSIKKLSKELVVYSDTALRGAASQTIDMTKRLGLTKEQMEQVILRAGDLGAGNLTLAESSERVADALGGQAKSVEKLGLALGDDYVRAQYEATNATGKAWEKMSEMEKAQERYNQFLKQTEGVLGRAGQQVNTFSGALALINKEIDNAISNNQDVKAAMQEVAKVLRENAGSIGQFISFLVTALAKVSAFVVEHKKLVLALLGTAAGVSVIGKLVDIFKGLHTVANILGLTSQIKTLSTALIGLQGSGAAAGAALQVGVAAAAAWGVVKIAELIKVIYEWRQAVNENKNIAAQRLTDAEQYAHAKNIELKSTAEFLKMSKEEQIAYRENSKAAILYWGYTHAALELQGKDAAEAKKRSAEVQKNSKEITAAWFNLQDMQNRKSRDRGDNTKEQPAKVLTREEQEKIAEDQKNLEQKLSEELALIDKDKWDKLRRQAFEHYKSEVVMAHENADLLKKAAIVYKAELAEIQKEENNERAEKLRAVNTAAIESEIGRTQALTETSLAALNRIYQRGAVSIEQYFNRRRELLEKQHQTEVAAQQKLIAMQSDPADRQRLEDDLFAKEQVYKRELIQLTEEQTRAEEALLQKKAETVQILDAAKMRLSEENAVSIADRNRIEMEQLRLSQDAERQALTDRLDLQNDYFNSKHRLEELDDIHAQERTQKQLEQERYLRKAQLNLTAELCGSTAELFAMMYEQTGKKHKEFFYLSKAAALAQAIINVAEGMTAAYKKGGIIGAIEGAIVAVQGGIQIGRIMAQHLAAGGQVQGSSPHDKADNIPIQATAGEFMQPVPSVKYYGTEVMEALRRRLIPHEIFASLKIPALTSRASLTLAEGGSVPSPNQKPESTTKNNDKTGVTIVNVPDPRMMDRYLASNAGQQMILNVLGNNAFQLKRIISEA